MNPFRRSKTKHQVTGDRFGEWLLGLFANGKPVSELSHPEIERLCADAAAVFVGAALTAPGSFEASQASAHTAALVARRTADGLRASLADPKNTVLAWPWDHMATTIAWEARHRRATEAGLGRAIAELAGAYALRHREQAGATVRLWQQVAGGIDSRGDLGRMGTEMLAAYRGTFEERAVQPAQPLPVAARA